MGKAITISNLEHSAETLRQLAAKAKEAAVVRRLLALALLLEGKSRTEAATQAGMQRQTLRDWVHRYNAEGVAGLASRVGPGPAPRLGDRQMAELKALVVAGPDPATDGVVRWRCVDLREQIIRRFSVTLHERSVGKLRLTQLQPRPCHPKTDVAAQEAFKKRARVAGPPAALETGRAIVNARGAAEKFLVDLTP
jgi:transposase